jgi:TPR repeat protein
MYLLGRSVPQDHAEALKWFRRAADQGLAHSEFMVGFAYRTGGYGVPQDHAQAIKWLRRAAQQGHNLAQSNLGFAYRDGEGVPQDYIQPLPTQSPSGSATLPQKLATASPKK